VHESLKQFGFIAGNLRGSWGNTFLKKMLDDAVTSLLTIELITENKKYCCIKLRVMCKFILRKL
jgi:hypothetical protein